MLGLHCPVSLRLVYSSSIYSKNCYTYLRCLKIEHFRNPLPRKMSYPKSGPSCFYSSDCFSGLHLFSRWNSYIAVNFVVYCKERFLTTFMTGFFAGFNFHGLSFETYFFGLLGVLWREYSSFLSKPAENVGLST